MENRFKNPAVNEQQRKQQRKRQIRNWIILLSVIPSPPPPCPAMRTRT